MQLYLKAYQVYERIESARKRDATPVDPDDFYDDDDDDIWFRGYGPGPVFGHGFGTSEDHEPAVGVLWFLEDKGHPYRYAILQHYGAPTPALDISFNAGVALWFATHEFRSDPGGVAHHYQSQECGVVYLISHSKDLVIDLRGKQELPAAGLRAQRQEGCLLLGVTTQQSDLSHHIVDVLEVDLSVFLSAPASVSSLKQSYLFPPRNEDLFFDALLNARLSKNETERELGKYFTVYV